MAGLSGLLAFLGFWRISGVSWSSIGDLWGSSDAVVEYSMSKSQGASFLGFFDSRLGFPHGQDWTHFPVLDMANRVELALLNTIFDPVTAVNILYTLSFPVVAVLMYAVLRNLRVGRALAVVGGVSLSLIGYHFDYEHPFLGNYWAIPVGILWLSILTNADSFLAHRCRPYAIVLVGVASGLVVGLNNPQYAVFFSLIGLVAVLVARTDVSGELGRLTRMALLLAPGAALLTSLAIGRLARVIPAVTSATDRPVIDSYVWAGKFISLLTVPGDSILSGIPFNGKLLAAQEIPEAMGVSAVLSAPILGATLLVIGLALALLAGYPRHGNGRQAQIERPRPWVAMWVAGASFFVTGGLGVAFSALVYPQVRGWARLAVILAALSLTAALTFTSNFLRQRKDRRSKNSTIGVVAMASLIAVLFLDQFTASYPINPDTSTLVELSGLSSPRPAELGDGCPILMYPIMSFPEAIPRGQANAYDQLLPYLAGIPGSFSYGAIRGQLGSRWTDHLSVQPQVLGEQAASEGFCAILVDSLALDERSPSLDQFEQVLGPATTMAMDRWYLFSLLRREGVSARDSLFSKPEVNYGTQLSLSTSMENGVVTRWVRGAEASLRVWNPGVEQMEWLAGTTVFAAECPNEQVVEITTESGFAQELQLTPGEQRDVLIPLRIPAKGSEVVQVRALSPSCVKPGEEEPVGVRISDLTYLTNSQSGAEAAAFSSFHPEEFSDSGDMWRWMDGDISSFEVISTSNRNTIASVTGQLQAPLCQPNGYVRVEVESQTTQTLPVTVDSTTNFVLPLALSPFGRATVTFVSSNPGCFVEADERLLGPKVQNLRIESTFQES